MKAHGGCYCGAVRYEVEGELTHGTLCHCEDCRRIAGAPAVAWFTVSAHKLHFTHRIPHWFHSSVHVQRAFCPQCGTPIAYRRDSEPGYLDVTTCSLDDPSVAPPKDHTFYHARLPWMQVCDALPKFERTRGEGQKE